MIKNNVNNSRVSTKEAGLSIAGKFYNNNNNNNKDGNYTRKAKKRAITTTKTIMHSQQLAGPRIAS